MGRAAVIVGSGHRRDAVFARTLAAEGLSVELLVHGDSNLPELPAEVKASVIDIADEEEVGAAVQGIAEKRGGIDVLITCPDFLLERALPEITEKEWEDCTALNLTSVFIACKQVAALMIARRSGRIINMTSDAGRMGAPNGAAYAAAKAGVVTFSKALAREVGGQGITVNVISLGVIEEANPLLGGEEGISGIVLKRPGTWEEVAGVMLCMIDERSRYLTGQTVHINGGLYMP